jgi:pilus assembly protein CpaB
MLMRRTSLLVLSAILICAVDVSLVTRGKAGERQKEAAAIDGVHTATIFLGSRHDGTSSVMPGDLVSILVTRDFDGRPVSAVILEAIPVVAVREPESNGADWPFTGHSVVVELDAVQAQKIVLAQQIGQLSAMLADRSPCRSDHFANGCLEGPVRP